MRELPGKTASGAHPHPDKPQKHLLGGPVGVFLIC